MVPMSTAASASGCQHGAHGGRIERRQVALDVDDGIVAAVGIDQLHRLEDAVGARGMVRPRQHGLAAGRPDGIDDRQLAAGHEHRADGGLDRPPPDMHDHGLAVDIGQRLVGQAGRGQAGGNDDDRLARRSGSQDELQQGLRHIAARPVDLPRRQEGDKGFADWGRIVALCARKEATRPRSSSFGCHPGESPCPYSRGRSLWAPAFAGVTHERARTAGDPLIRQRPPVVGLTHYPAAAPLDRARVCRYIPRPFKPERIHRG